MDILFNKYRDFLYRKSRYYSRRKLSDCLERKFLDFCYETLRDFSKDNLNKYVNLYIYIFLNNILKDSSIRSL